MFKVARGIYENGKIKVPKKDLPETDEKLGIIVVFMENSTNEQQLKEDIMIQLDLTPSITSERKSLKVESSFFIADSSFFSLSPEHLGRTFASDLDEIIAKEAIGHK